MPNRICAKALKYLLQWSDTLLSTHHVEKWNQNPTLSSQNTHQYNNIHSSLHQQVQSVFVVLSGADGGSAQQLFPGVFGGQRVIPVLLQIRPGDYSHQLVVIIHYRELAWLMEKENIKRRIFIYLFFNRIRRQ